MAFSADCGADCSAEIMQEWSIFVDVTTQSSCATIPVCGCTGSEGAAAAQGGYNESIGGFCLAWDAQEPYCMEGGSSYGASWCSAPWCYSPAWCNGSVPSGYFDSPPSLWYNYGVCNAIDTYSATLEDGEEYSGTAYVSPECYETCNIVPPNSCEQMESMAFGCAADCPIEVIKTYADNLNCSMPACECTGNEGAAAAQGEYVDEIGSYCHSWDDDEPYCQCPLGSNFGASWCLTKWCYTPAWCTGGTQSTYFNPPPQLWYSYDVCDDIDTYTEVAHSCKDKCEAEPSNCDEVDEMSLDCGLDCPLEIIRYWTAMYNCSSKPACQCTGNEGAGAAQGGYNESIGEYCFAWDDQEPYCMQGGLSYGASWCSTPWCYSPAWCMLGIPSGYFDSPPALWYNYATCGGIDTYTTCPTVESDEDVAADVGSPEETGKERQTSSGRSLGVSMISGIAMMAAVSAVAEIRFI